MDLEDLVPTAEEVEELGGRATRKCGAMEFLGETAVRVVLTAEVAEEVVEVARLQTVRQVILEERPDPAEQEVRMADPGEAEDAEEAPMETRIITTTVTRVVAGHPEILGQTRQRLS